MQNSVCFTFSSLNCFFKDSKLKTFKHTACLLYKILYNNLRLLASPGPCNFESIRAYFPWAVLAKLKSIGYVKCNNDGEKQNVRTIHVFGHEFIDEFIVMKNRYSVGDCSELCRGPMFSLLLPLCVPKKRVSDE